MATEVAQAVVALIPSAQGIGAAIQKEIAGDLVKAGKSGGETLGKEISKSAAAQGKLAGDKLGKSFREAWARQSKAEGASFRTRLIGTLNDAQLTKAAGNAGERLGQRITGGMVKETAKASQQITADVEKTSKRSSKLMSAIGSGAGFGVATTVVSGLITRLGSYVSGATEAADATLKFQNTLKFANIGTDQIAKVTQQTQAYADKTVYDLADIQNMTAQLASNGIKNYEGLAEAAGNLNAIAGGNAETFQSVGMVMTQTAGAGKLTTENWNQLADAIPGASGKLQAALKANGAYTGNFRDAMAKGQITAQEFNKAILQLGTSDVAKHAATSTQTFEGAWGNFEATVTGGLAKIMTVVRPTLTELLGLISNGIGPVFSGIASGVDKAIKLAGPVLQRFGAVITGTVVPAVRMFGAGITSQVVPMMRDFAGVVAAQVWPTLQRLGVLVRGTIVPAVLSVGGAIASHVVPIATALVEQLRANVLPALSSLWSVISAKLIPFLIRTAQVILPIAASFGRVVASILGTVIPVLIRVAGPILGAVIRAAGSLISKGVSLASSLGTAFRSIGSGATWLWKTVGSAFTKIKSGVDAVKKAFDTAKAGIGKVWSSLASTISSPVNSALKWLQNNFIDKLNSMLSKIGLSSLKLPTIWSADLGPAGGGGAAGGRGKTAVPGLAGGGKVRGPWRGATADNVLGVDRRGMPLARINPGEQIIRVASTRRMDRENPGALDYINQWGQLPPMPGYYIGGKISGLNSTFVQMLSKFNDATGDRYTVTSGFRSRAQQERLYAAYLNGTGNLAAKPGTSNHEKGLAADLSPSNARDVSASIAARFGLHFPVRGEAWHIEPINLSNLAATTATGDAGTGGITSAVLSKLKSLINNSVKGVTGFFPSILANRAAKIGSSIIDKASSYLISDTGSGGYEGSYTNSGGVTRWTSVAQSAMARAGLPSSYLSLLLHRMQVESGGNPRAQNNWDINAKNGTPSKGLMQVIQPTFDAYAGELRSKGIWDPEANIYAAIKYTLSRYGLSGINTAWGGTKGYAHGGFTTAGMALVGENGPELVRFSGNQYVYPAQQTQQMLSGQSRLHPDDMVELAALISAGVAGPIDSRAARVVGREAARVNYNPSKGVMVR